MKAHTNNSVTPLSVPLRSRLPDFLVAAAILLLLLSGRSTTFAGSATWDLSPGSGVWNTNANWTPNTAYPNGSSDVATFDVSNTTAVSLGLSATVAEIIFNSGASPFTITVNATKTLTIGGTGITNNSGITQNFVTTISASGQGSIVFNNSATAGSMTAYTNTGSTFSGVAGGFMQFFGGSNAGSATITNNGATVSGGNGVTYFTSSSSADSATITNNGGTASSGSEGETFFTGVSNTFPTAGNGTFTNNGGTVSGGFGGETVFNGVTTSAGETAGSGTFTNNAGIVAGAFGGITQFNSGSTAGSATLIANGGVGAGGSIQFSASSTGGTASVDVRNNGTGTAGNLDISGHIAGSVTIGSLEGSGNVFLGANNLTVGSNNLSKTFSGVIQDGGIGGGTGGSLTKTGTGKLTLTTGNTYTGATTVNGGTLFVKNKTGSGTGTGAVQVNTGTLEGVGNINGAVTVGDGTTLGAILLAGNSATSPGTLTINNTLTFQPHSTYKCVLNRTKGKASTITAVGVTINSNVHFKFVDHGTGTLTVGTVFPVINNTSANPIVGTFSNLADGSTFPSNGNNFKVSYTGGTGNDLTLTVVP